MGLFSVLEGIVKPVVERVKIYKQIGLYKTIPKPKIPEIMGMAEKEPGFFGKVADSIKFVGDEIGPYANTIKHAVKAVTMKVPAKTEIDPKLLKKIEEEMKMPELNLGSLGSKVEKIMESGNTNTIKLGLNEPGFEKAVTIRKNLTARGPHSAVLAEGRSHEAVLKQLEIDSGRSLGGAKTTFTRPD